MSQVHKKHRYCNTMVDICTCISIIGCYTWPLKVCYLYYITITYHIIHRITCSNRTTNGIHSLNLYSSWIELSWASSKIEMDIKWLHMPYMDLWRHMGETMRLLVCDYGSHSRNMWLFMATFDGTQRATCILPHWVTVNPNLFEKYIFLLQLNMICRIKSCVF